MDHSTQGEARVPKRLIAAIAVMVLSTVGLLVAFALSLEADSRQFEHALIAQRQATLVEGIARDAGVMDAISLKRSFSAYTRLIDDERRYLPGGEADPAELGRARRFASIVPIAADRAQVAALVHEIAQAEAREVVQARTDLNATRRHTLTLAVLLASVALVATGFGAWQLNTSNRNLSAQVAARTADLRAIDQSRRLFFAKASHELRTPVTAIRALAEVAQGHGDAQGALDDIVAQAGFLGHRIDEMLALAKAAEGRPSLQLASADLRDIVADAVAQATPYARSIDVAIHPQPNPSALVILADSGWLEQAVLTIIDNGLKFSDPGGALELEVTCCEGTAVLSIADCGPGVLPRELPRIFDAYYQAEAGRMRGGTGLGLALARWVVEQHGGTIHAENCDQGGCRIVIELPLEKNAHRDCAG